MAYPFGYKYNYNTSDKPEYSIKDRYLLPPEMRVLVREQKPEDTGCRDTYIKNNL
jgi:hypothetical protein